MSVGIPSTWNKHQLPMAFLVLEVCSSLNGAHGEHQIFGWHLLRLDKFNGERGEEDFMCTSCAISSTCTFLATHALYCWMLIKPFNSLKHNAHRAGVHTCLLFC